MPGTTSDTSASDNLSGKKPDNFAYHINEVKKLLAESESFLPSTGKTCETPDDKDSASFLSNGVGVGLLDSQMERLNALLRQAVATLTPEVDAMLDPVKSMCELQSEVRSKKVVADYNVTSKGRPEKNPKKKLKTSSSSLPSTNITPSARTVSSESCQEGDDDLHFLLENDSSVVEETLKKYSDELITTLGHMENQLEELLDTVVSACRPMNIAQKQQLQKMIKKLPQKNLNRIAEIVERGQPRKTSDANEIVVNLDAKDAATLWRLYYYVETVQKAKDLASLSAPSS